MAEAVEAAAAEADKSAFFQTYGRFFMKIKKDFVLRELAGGYVATAIGSAAAGFKGIIKLNESGALIWRELENGATLESCAEKLCNTYNIDSKTALSDCKDIIEKLRGCGALDE